MKASDRHKSQREGEGSKSCPSKGKEPIGPAGQTLVPRPRRPKSMKELYQTSTGEGDAGYYTLLMTNLSTNHIHDAGRVISVMDNNSKGLKKEIVDLRAGSGPEAVATAE
ncbi:hypothetical protein B296_00032084 [Ensete ventricosum]|uniref:Uncharacterized protein n=1 Tax=Ensete ventricosum TaxID=4639 RepID=A0A427AC75_ENSVE|nr:hypothetical protein B296_00032084 [Ensete ventricosum]